MVPKFSLVKETIWELNEKEENWRRAYSFLRTNFRSLPYELSLDFVTTSLNVPVGAARMALEDMTDLGLLKRRYIAKVPGEGISHDSPHVSQASTDLSLIREGAFCGNCLLPLQPTDDQIYIHYIKNLRVI